MLKVWLVVDGWRGSGMRTGIRGGLVHMQEARSRTMLNTSLNARASTPPLLHHPLVGGGPDRNSAPNNARSCGRKRSDQLHTHQGSLCTSCLGSCNFVHIQKLLSVHYKLTKSLLLLLLDGWGAFIKRQRYAAAQIRNHTHSSRN